VLLDLVVENYAVVERIRVHFHAGLNLLTGETGSGKSIVVDALGLLLGGRASAEMVRSETTRARISGIFELPQNESLTALLETAGVQAEDGELLIEREIQAGGKSRAFAGSRPVTAAFLRDLAPYLGDIHGQHDQQLLFSPEIQLRVLDDFAGNVDLLRKTAELYRRWESCTREIEELDRSEQEKLRMLDLWSFQRSEIESAAVRKGEDADLEKERAVQRNVTRLQESANAAYDALYEAADSASSRIRLALKKVDELFRIDASLGGVLETLKPADIAVDEAATTLRHYLDRLEADPDRLDEIETRLALLDRLKRKYGPTLDEVVQFLETVRGQIKGVEHAGERRAQLERELESLTVDYKQSAAELTTVRKAAAQKLAAKIERELASLALASTVFQIQINPASWSVRGADRVLFLISSNVGEEPKPLDKVASGGELSRIALALKTCVGQAGNPSGAGKTQRTLVFDEVDTGIGGAVAESVGRRLKKLAAANQVLCVTHLAQIAGFADHHYYVEKREVKGRTIAEIDELAGEARTREIGRMLSGQRLTPEALKHAEQLIKSLQ
jgi:DNA repair protein RecN (Recombination protein N)